MGSWIFDELNRREFIKKAALTGAAAYVGFDYETAPLNLLRKQPGYGSLNTSQPVGSPSI